MSDRKMSLLSRSRIRNVIKRKAKKKSKKKRGMNKLSIFSLIVNKNYRKKTKPKHIHKKLKKV